MEGLKRNPNEINPEREGRGSARGRGQLAAINHRSNLEEEMTLLKDDEIYDLVFGESPIVTNYPFPPVVPTPEGEEARDPWFGPQSPVQASSLDLHVGQILVPKMEQGKPGSVAKPLEELALKLGHTVVVVTQEELRLPNRIGAFGFPPARLSSRGLLMTNPGHVDPGFHGPMRFTVMNIGTEDITLRRGDPIVTLLLLRLSADAKAGYAQRRGFAKAVSGPEQRQVDCLSVDFLEVGNRAKSAAEEAVRGAEYRAKLWSAIVPIGSALAVVIAGVISLWIPVQQMKTEVEGVKKVLDMQEQKSRLDRLDELELLQEKIKAIEASIIEDAPGVANGIDEGNADEVDPAPANSGGGDQS